MALPALELDYEDLFDCANDPIFLFPMYPEGRLGNFIRVNEAACALLDYSQDELKTYTPLDISQPSAIDRIPSLFVPLLQTGELSFEGAYRHRCGEYIPLEYHARLIHKDDHAIILVHARDLRNRNAVMRELEMRNYESRMIFEMCPDMLGIVTGEYVTDINSAGVRLLRASDRESVLGRSFYEFLHPDFHAIVNERLHHQNRQIGQSTSPMEQVYIRDDNTTVRVEVQSILLPNHDVSTTKTPKHLFLSRDITSEVEYREHLFNMAYRDFLTGIWNRRKLLEHLQELIVNPSSKIALLFLDLDNFKQVNDTFGHDVGDTLLIEVANRLQKLASDDLFISRTGGDEFCMVYTEYHLHTDIERIGNEVIRSFDEPFVLDATTLQCTVSVGAAEYGNAILTSRDLMKAGDIALYEAKDNGRNRLVVKESL